MTRKMTRITTNVTGILGSVPSTGMIMPLPTMIDPMIKMTMLELMKLQMRLPIFLYPSLIFLYA